MTRIDDLLSAMSVEEKIGQLTMVSGTRTVTGPGISSDLASAVRTGRAGSIINFWGVAETRELQRIATAESRLGIPVFFSLDVLHGFETMFPIPLGEACAFDDELWARTAEAAAQEAVAAGIHLTFAPMLDIARDPRWGRMAEGPGEDPVLGVRLARAKVRGFQGADLAGGGLAATAKHLAGYGLPQAGREYASVEISERTLHEIYLPPFEAAVRAGVAAIMPAFHDIAGVPMSANRKILRDLVRGVWGFEGVYISDYDAIAELIHHGVAGDLAEAAVLALKAGIDIDMMARAYERGLPIALARDPALMTDIDDAVRRVLRFKEHLGLFDAQSPRRTLSDPPPPPARALAREAAQRAVVLLTNQGVLPLSVAPGRIAVLGPLANSADDMLGPWAAAGVREGTVTILEGLKAALPGAEIDFAPGVELWGKETSGIAGAVACAQNADVVVMCLGENRNMSGEAASRAEPVLPRPQAELAAAVLATGKPVIVVLSSGRPLVAPWLFAAAQAVLATWFLGSEAGHAVADILTGAVAPTGRLAVSWPRSIGQIPIFHAERPTGRPANPNDHFTSKYLDVSNDPQFPFGHGLSYTTFDYANLRATPSPLVQGAVLHIAVDVTNTGTRTGEETVLVFLHDCIATIAQPVLAFKASAKITLGPGETGTVSLTLPPDAFSFLGADLVPVTEPGAFEILVGQRADRAHLLSTRVTLATS